MLTENASCHASWVDATRARGFQVMEASDQELLSGWTSYWDDLVEFEVVPVRTSCDYWSRIQPD